MLTGTALLSLLMISASFAQTPGLNTDKRTRVQADYMAPAIDISNQGAAKIYTDGSVTITEMANEYLFPSSIDATGSKVVIQNFGASENSYYWSKETGLESFSGSAVKITSNGKVAGDFMYDGFPGGQTAQTGGIYSIADGTWTFLGINPEYPNIVDETYNSAWGMSDDGTTIVGLQLHEGWAATAFKWTAENGYQNIGNSLEYDSRASGISRNGAIIFGWASTEMGFWSPVIWHDDTYTLLNPGGDGEVMCASAEGTFVAGVLAESAFIWSQEGGMQPFGTYDDYPTIVMEDGSAFGFTGVFPAVIRRAFYKDPEGNMHTFNDYAQERGMLNAQDWTFYSVNDVTPDGNRFIGAAINPDGQDVSFLLEFSGTVGVNQVQPESVKVFPNPATDKVTIESNFKKATIRLFDLQGRLVFESQKDAAQTIINLDSFTKGVYMLSIEHEGEIIRKKINLL